MKVTLQKNRLVSSILVCWLTLSSCAMADTTLYLAGSDKNSSEYQQFAQNHPELTIHTETNLFLSTNEIISAFLTFIKILSSVSNKSEYICTASSINWHTLSA